ncbi:EF-hand domain-containing protein [Glaciecola sp. SC05]|uniref:EF-hand domain-containing protein n=1 Tax=Glaciecola sp. SC05 TaxID=1987355 RepID=UPI003527C475
MSFSTKLIASVLSIIFVASLSVNATASDDLFNALDVDQSGSISKAEANAHSGLSNMFNEIDVDGDGEITYAEFIAAGLEE